MRRLLVCISLLLLISSCFRRFIKSDAEIEKHYSHRTIKPAYHTLDTLGLKVHYVTVGTDSMLPLLVMVHGAPGAWYGWMSQLDDSVLQKNFRMISYDRPGYQKSRMGRTVPDIDTQTWVLNALVKLYKKGNKVIVMGRSYGSPIAAMSAAQHPNLVDGLVLISSASDSASEKYYWFSPLGKTKVMRALLPTPLNSATDEKYTHPKELGKAQKYYSQIKCPTVILYGDRDYIADNINSQKLDSQMVCSPHKIICLKGADHFIAMKKPELVREELLKMSHGIGVKSQY